MKGLLRRVKTKWEDLTGTLEAYFPEGEAGKAHAAAVAAAKEKGERVPPAVALDPQATLEQCGIKSSFPPPTLFVIAPELKVLDEAVAGEQKPAAVAAAQAALARAMGEENAEAEAAAAAAAAGQSAAEVAAAAAAVTAADPAEAVANAMTELQDLSATNGGGLRKLKSFDP